jgi:hypothetical protein
VDLDSSWEFGTYPTTICADFLDVVVESEEGNKCRPLRRPIAIRGTGPRDS